LTSEGKTQVGWIIAIGHKCEDVVRWIMPHPKDPFVAY
jgi:hypothetical protein